MTQTTRHAVLTRRIPGGGFGRQITSTERRRLADLGVNVPTRTRVLQVFGADYTGALYRPLATGWAALDVSVTLVAEG